jgi:tetratricopeptide (TPR) repeat protein
MSERIPLMVFGGILAFVGVFLFATGKTTRGRNKITFFGATAELSTPSLIIFIVGCGLFVFPFTSRNSRDLDPQSRLQPSLVTNNGGTNVAVGNEVATKPHKEGEMFRAKELYNRAGQHYQLKELPLAITNLDLAIWIQEGLVSGGRKEVTRDLADSLNYRARIYNDQGNFEEALSMYKRAIDYAKDLYDQMQETANLATYVTGLNGRALVYENQDKFVQGIDEYRHSIDIQQQRQGSKVGNDGTNKLLAKTLLHRAKLYETKKDFVSAALADYELIIKLHADEDTFQDAKRRSMALRKANP